jgi:type IV pilus assembly protein PilB
MNSNQLQVERVPPDHVAMPTNSPGETDMIGEFTHERGRRDRHDRSRDTEGKRTSERPRLGDLLTQRGLVTAEQLREALVAQNASGLRLGTTLAHLGLLSDRSLAEVLAEQFGAPLVDLAHVNVEREIALLLPEATAKQLCAVPIARHGERIDVAVGDPYAPDLQDQLIDLLGAPVRLVVAAEGDILQTIDSVSVRSEDMDEALELFHARDAERRRPMDGQPAAATADDNAPVVRVVNLILEQAVRERASDVHIEPEESRIRVRVRTDGALHEVMSLPLGMGAPLVSRVKVLADLNIVEHRRPQDGTFTASVLGRHLDVRVATSPTVFGEMCCLRLLDKSRAFHQLDKLGMHDEVEERYRSIIHSPFGLVACAGPTGSGKTTTLYATMAALNDVTIKVTTIEDPVEYVIPTINQIQIHEASGLTFAAGLRAVLRQDPDTILVGEIRDVDTARIAVQAALTGHFVMTSVHATDASSALHRFLDMGIEPFLLASALTGVVGQRLLRRNCPRCSVEHELAVEERAFIERMLGAVPTDATFRRGEGCNFCRGTGFFERVGVYEVLIMTEEMRELILRSAQQRELRELAQAEGMRTMSEQAAMLVSAGTTTVAEVLRTVVSG